MLGEPYYEVVRWEVNTYNKDDFELQPDGLYKYKGNIPNYYVSASVFENQECCYTICIFKQDKDGWYIENVLDRIVTSYKSAAEMLEEMQVISWVFNYLNNL